MYTVGKIALTAAVAITLSLVAPSAHANKLTEPQPAAAKPKKPKKAKKRVKKTAKQVRTDRLKAVLDPDLGFGLGPVEQAQPVITVKRKKQSKRALRRKARIAAKRRKTDMAKAMSVGLGGRQKMRRTRAEETMVLAEQNLSDRQVKTSIRANRESVDVCIERAAARGQAPSGHVNTSFTIEPRGHVTSVRVVTSGRHAKRLKRCVTRAIKRWKFPASDAATEVEFPLVLDVGGAALGAND